MKRHKVIVTLLLLLVFVLGVWAAWWWLAVAKPMRPDVARKWTSLSLAKFRVFSLLGSRPEVVVTKAYAEGMEFISTTNQFAIVSAEKLWLRPQFKADIPDWHLSDWYLLPEPYLRKHHARLGDAKRVFSEHGAGFEVLTLHTNLLAEVPRFNWSPPLPPNHSGGGYGLPLMWSKHPELCDGVRFFVDVRGHFGKLPEPVFTNYLRAATAWVRRDAPDTWIDSLVATENWADAHNGIVLLLRQAPTNLVSRLVKACEGSNVNTVSMALAAMREYETVEAVHALAHACKYHRKDSFARGHMIAMLKRLSKSSAPDVQAAAEAALEEL